jgi:glycosyltransferase involved in cell wall biosynthesis
VAERVHVLYLIDYFHRTGGTEKHLAQLVERLPRQTFKCSIVAFDLGANPLLDKVRDSGITVIHVPVGREYVPNAWLRALQLSKLLRTLQPDIVQTFHQKSDTYGAIIARLSGVRHIVSSKRDTGALRAPHHFFLNRRLGRLFERVIVVADAVGSAVMTTDKIEPARIVRIYNGVDTEEFAPSTPPEAAESRHRLGIGADDFVLGMVAGFRPEKNHDILFGGASRALAAIPSLKILAVGGGPLLDHYRRVTEAGPLRGRVVLTGDVRDVTPYLAAMDVGCLVSGSNEGFSNAVLEMMAAGLPMIVTDVGGNAEAVLQDDNGFVIPPLDAGALQQALLDSYADQSRRAAMGRRARQLAEEKFSLKRMCDDHARLYLSLCEPHRQADASPLPRAQ